MKKLLLTGGTGFIGRQTVKLAIEKGYEVHAAFIGEEPFLSQESNLFWHRCDLLDRNQQKDLLARVKPSHLLHFAWVTIPGEYWTSSDNIRWLQASLDLLMGFKEYGGKRVVMAGTCAEYDWGYDGYFSEKITPVNPRTIYGACKKSLQEILGAFSEENGISSAWGRMFFLYGLHENSRRLVPSVIKSLLKGETARCSHSEQIRDFLFVKDAASAFIALLESAVQGPVNIASGQPVSLKHIIEIISQRLGHPELIEFGAMPVSADDPPMLVADVTRLRQEVGWHPMYSLEDGLSETINWWSQKI